MKYDLDCRLLDSLDGRDEAIKRLSNTLLAMQEDHGISCFYLSHEFDPLCTSPAEEALRIGRLETRVKENLSSKLRVKLYSALTLQSGISDAGALPLLGGFLPMRLPLFPDTEMIDGELNRLLYQQNIAPLFLSFENVLSVYPKEFTEKLLRIQNAAFCFSFRSFADKQVQHTVRHLLSSNQNVLFGSGLRMPERLAWVEYSDFEVLSKERLTYFEQDRMHKTAQRFWSV